jgi:hypothetical protein
MAQLLQTHILELMGRVIADVRVARKGMDTVKAGHEAYCVATVSPGAGAGNAHQKLVLC